MEKERERGRERERLFNIVFFRYLKFREQIQFESLPGLVYCPRAACNAMVTSDPASQLAVCDSCGFPFCKECRQTWHGVERCSVFDKVREKWGGGGRRGRGGRGGEGRKEKNSCIGCFLSIYSCQIHHWMPSRYQLLVLPRTRLKWRN